MKKRIICMLLALLMLVGMLPVGVFAENATDYEKNVHGTAVFNAQLKNQVVYIQSDPSQGYKTSGDYTLTVDDALLSQTFFIADCYTDTSGYWYKLEARDGETLPTKLSAKAWVYQNDIPNMGYEDALIVTPPANTCRCCESCTGEEGCACHCGECDFCEEEVVETPSVSDPVTNTVIYAESIPADVTPVVNTNADVSQQLQDYGIPASNVVFGWDISLVNGDSTEYQPEGGATVKVPVEEPEGTLIGLLHNGSFMGLTSVLSDGTVEFYTDSFSEFVGFTVDFHYNGIDFSILGMSEILLSELFVELGIEEDAHTAESVVFSNESLVLPERQSDGDWLLKSLEAFQTNETLIITFEDEHTIIIDVTDAVDRFLEYFGGVVRMETDGSTPPTQRINFTYRNQSGAETSAEIKYYVLQIQSSTRFLKSGAWFHIYEYDGVKIENSGNESLYSIAATAALAKNRIIKFQEYPTAIKLTNSVQTINAADVVNVSVDERVSTSTARRNVIVRLNGTEIGRAENILFPNRNQTGNGWDQYNGLNVSFDTNKYAITYNTYSVGTVPYAYSGGDNGTYTLDLYSRYNVAFNGNGGSGSMPNQAFVYGTAQNLNANEFKAPTFTVSYESNGGTAASNATSATQFASWNTKADGFGTKYTDTQNVNNLTTEAGGTFPLYAQWTATSNVTLPSKTAVTKTGYTLEGWYEDQAFTVKAGNPGATYTPKKSITLYAKWTPNPYKVTLDNQSATTAGTTAYWYLYKTTKVVNNETVYYWTDSACTAPLSGYTITKPTKTGYTFGGYYTGTNGSGTQYVDANGMCVNNLYSAVAANSTLYAKWIPNPDTQYYIETYTQNLENNDYTQVREIKTGTTGATVTASTAAREGFTYNASKSTVSGTIAADGSLVLKVYYDRNTYTVTTQKGTGISAVTGGGSYKYGASVTIGATVSDGYAWSNWTGTSTQTTQSYTFTMPASNVTYTANATANTYKVHFDGNGATSGAMNDQSFTYGTAQNLTANAFERKFTVTYHTDGGDAIDAVTASATFNGWATSATGAKVYDNKHSVNNLATTNTTVNLYAKWTDGSVTLPTPTKEGFDFKGWYTDAACSAANKVTGTTYTPTSDVTLYAKWESIGAYKVTYQYEGTVPGAAPAVPAAADVRVGDPVTVKTTANITGYTFSGWTTSDAEIKDGKFTMPAKAVTLTGKWIPISYTVKFNGSEGTGSVADIPAKYGEEVTLPDNGFQRVIIVTYDVNGGTEVDPKEVKLEAEFNGWKKENSGDTVAAGTKVSNLTAKDRETVTYYADWKYRSTTTPTTAKPGYAFGGWTNSGTETMEAGEKFTPTTDIELTAVWTANDYTITYNHNDVTSGDPTITTDTYTIEEALTLAEAPTREGYKFTGWELEKAVTEPDGNWDADTYSAAQTFEKGKYGDIELVAKWTEQYYYVLSFNFNGGTGDLTVPAVGWCDETKHTFTWDKAKIPTRDGYTFMGWAETADSKTNVAGTDMNTYTLAGQPHATVTKTLYAIWQRDTGTITLNYSGSAPVVVTITCTDAVNDSEKITIQTVVTESVTIPNLPTGTYTVSAVSGNANYTASVNPGSAELEKGDTEVFTIGASSRTFSWKTGFSHVINKRGG